VIKFYGDEINKIAISISGLALSLVILIGALAYRLERQNTELKTQVETLTQANSNLYAQTMILAKFTDEMLANSMICTGSKQ
jgi:hypothetical protein